MSLSSISRFLKSGNEEQAAGTGTGEKQRVFLEVEKDEMHKIEVEVFVFCRTEKVSTMPVQTKC